MVRRKHTNEVKIVDEEKSTWAEMVKYLNAAGYVDRVGDACKTRIHTLVAAYRSCMDNINRTGGPTQRKPPGFDLLDRVLRDKPATIPYCVISSIEERDIVT